MESSIGVLLYLIGMVYSWVCQWVDNPDIQDCLGTVSASGSSVTVYGINLEEAKSYKYTVIVARSGKTAQTSKVITVRNLLNIGRARKAISSN